MHRILKPAFSHGTLTTTQQQTLAMCKGISWTELFIKCLELLQNMQVSISFSHPVPVPALILYLFSNTITIYLCSLCRCWFYIYQFSDSNVNRYKAEVKQGHLMDWAVRPMMAFSDTHHPFLPAIQPLNACILIFNFVNNVQCILITLTCFDMSVTTNEYSGE